MAVVGDTELGINQLPQNANFQIQFSNLTENGSVLNITGHTPTITGFRCTVNPALTGLSLIVKQCDVTGISGPHAADMDVDFTTQTVTVRFRPSEISNNYGQYYCALWALTASGDFLTHNVKYFVVQQQISPS